MAASSCTWPTWPWGPALGWGEAVRGASVIVTGSELLTGAVADTNGSFLARRLAALGVACRAITAVGDDPTALEAALRLGLRHSRLVVVTGGLGPTRDDLTRHAVAAAVGRPLVEAPALARHRAAPVPEGAEQVVNPLGSAAGFWLEAGGAAVCALPGVPWELEAMWGALEPRLRAWFPEAEAGAFTTLRTVGLSEREVESRLEAAQGTFAEAGARVGVTARPLAVDVHLWAPGRAAAARAAEAARKALGDTVYAEGAETLARVVGEALRAAGRRIATAESCTGGALCAALVAVPGASDYVDRGVVAYADRAKTDLLGVPEDVLAAHGAVSDPVARAMAEGLLARSGVDVTVAVTGIAGPTGGAPDKPVGLVFMALAEAGGTFCRPFRHNGDRERFIARTVTRALDLVRLHLAGGLAALEGRYPPDP
jgi:nicotinamide-nucleotide amidase